MAISLLDFSLDSAQLRYEAYHCIDSFANSPEIVLVDVYRGLIKTRHDALHYFSHKSLGLRWFAEKKLSEVFAEPLPDEFKNKTPDTCFEKLGSWWLIDYSISVDIHRSSSVKLNKYGPIVEFLNNRGIITKFIHINVLANYSNLEFEIGKLAPLSQEEFDYTGFLEICNTLNEHKVAIGHRINPAVLDKVKGDYSGDDSEFMETTVGTYKDLDIDLEGFRAYNKSFDHMKKVKESIQNCDIDSIENELFHILEDDSDPIHLKYRDKKLSMEQFENAYQEIIGRNTIAPKTEARPSHHMLIPLPTDILHTGVKLNEQESVYSFAREFNSFYSENKHKYSHHRLAFISCVLHSLVDCLDGDDGNTYKTIYDSRNDSYVIEFNEYKEIKKSRSYLSIFYSALKKLGKPGQAVAKYIQTKNKLPDELPTIRLQQSLLTQTAITLDKSDNKACWEFFRRSLTIVEANKGVKTFPDLLYKKGILKQDPREKSCYIIGDKKIRMPKEKQPQLVKLALEKAGIKADVEQKSRSPCQPRGVIPISDHTVMDDLIKYMIQPGGVPEEYKLHEYLIESSSTVDSPVSNRLKDESIFDYEMYLSPIMETNAYKYSHYSHLAYNQLFHVNEYKSDNETMHVFNLGIDNFCCIVALTRSEREGKPFLCVVKTKTPELYTNFWGKLNKIKIPKTDYYYIYTNWRRLDNNKITYLRDVHYSVLSSTMNSAMSNPMALKFVIDTRLKELYTFRMLIALSANQKTSELLLDTRYAYMSSISWYTDLGKLLVEKFGYQFNTVIEAWIIWRLITRLKEINHAAQTGGIVNYRLNIDLKTKDIQSIGGHIRLPSLWHDYTLTDITELLDEAFVYVHTIKEPANIFHEQIKAVQTIIKFQNEYDQLPDYIKTGSINSADQLRSFLIRDGYLGCCTAVINKSTTINIATENPNLKQYIHEIASESVGDLLSTKAVISEHKREIITDKKTSRRELKKSLKRQQDVLGIKTTEQAQAMTTARLKISSRFYNDYKPRQKVWETIMEYLENDKHIERTVHLANYFLINPMVQADICIKSQYGGKREFYVVNITAKALARLTENFFRMISQNSEHEAISIPGDKKVMKMQRMLDLVHTMHKTENHEIIYTNGDCTKWSAAETMPSFLAMVSAFEDKLPPGIYEVLIATFNAWSNKKIQLPMDIYNKVIPTENFNTDYLKKLKEKNTPQITSTQNFLQGMFNYSSSYKAVCCQNYTYTLWRKYYPKSDLKIEHLEHSDDYVTVCLYTDIKEFEKYRLLNKMIMRLHGYNDSERKTCSQPYIMEFVSQMSHNGVMLYPQIKKSKEVNLSLPCTGYTKDMDAAMSRVGECARVGCNLSFLYFFQRLHTVLVADAYSILPGMRNNMNRSFKDLMCQPVELFGIPDPHPIFSLYCRGNINNYRLYNYGDSFIKDNIRKLYKKSLYISSIEGVSVEKEDDRYCLATPRFLYDMGNKSLAKLKKNIDIPIDNVRSFWCSHPVYKLIKPRTNENLLTWVKSMFYNRSFMEAYSTTTRARMTLRIPRYVSKQMIVETVELEKHYEKKQNWGTKIMTMVEYYNRIQEQFSLLNLTWNRNDEVHLSRVLTKCDPTVTQIYSILDTITISLTDMTRKQTIQVSANQPRKTTTISLVNEPAILLQYILDRDCFMADKRRVKSRGSLEKDVLIILEKYGEELKDTKNTMALLSVYNDLMITRQPQNVVYTYDRHCVTLLDFIMSTFRNNYHPGLVCKVTHTNVSNIIDPTTLQTLFLKQHRHTKDYHRQCLDNLCLIHVFLTHTQALKKQAVLNILGSLRFEMPDGSKLNYKELLSHITEDYMIINDFTTTERKIASYLCAYYLNNYDLLENLVNNNYSFSYRYNQKAFKRGTDYVGDTIVTFSHFNTVVKAYHNSKSGDPIIVMHKHYPSASPTLYNIALRLTDCIKQTQYEEDSTLDRRKIILGGELKEKILELRIPSIIYAIKPGPNDYDQCVKTKKIKDHEYYYPILITGNTIKRGGGHHFSKQKAHPHLDNDNLVVKLGKSKLFVLPYWRCNQYDNMTIGHVEINGIPFDELIKERRIEYYLMSINKLRNTTQISYSKPIEYMIERVKSHIKNQKIYDFKFGDIIRGATSFLEILNSDGKEKIDGGFIVPVPRQNINVESDEELGIEMPHYTAKTPGEALIQNKSTSPDLMKSFGSFNMNSFLVEEEYDDVGCWEEESMVFEQESTINPRVAAYIPEDDYQYKNELGDHIFTLEMGNQEEMFEGKIVDDTSEALNEGLNYHIKEYIGEDVYHREIHGKIMDDKFLIDPRTKKRVQKSWKKNEYDYYSQMGSNYMVLRLKKIPDYLVLMLLHQERVPIGVDLMNIYSFKQNLQQVIDLLNRYDPKFYDQKDILILWLFLEKLLCRTYIVDSLTHKQSVGFAYDTENNIHLGVWTDTRGKYNDEQKKSMLSRGKILAIDGDHLLVRTTMERFEKQVDTGVKTGILTFQPLLVSRSFDKRINDLTLKLTSSGTEDLLELLD